MSDFPSAALERVLRARVDGEVRFDAGSRGAYSTDASNFRQVPIGVVGSSRCRGRDPDGGRVPRARSPGAVPGRRYQPGRSMHQRGRGHRLDEVLPPHRLGGRSAATASSRWTKCCHRIVSADEGRRRCMVEPGIVLDELNRQLAPTGLRYGPEPATHPNCTLGGMIGNNSCGATAQRTGKVVDNTPRLEVLLYDGTRFWAQGTDDEYARIVAVGDRRAEIYRRLRALAETYAPDIRARFPGHPASGVGLQPRFAPARARPRPRRPARGQRVDAGHRAPGRARARARAR